jgi:hypothetical protein
VLLDTTDMGVEEAVAFVLHQVQAGMDAPV